MSWRIEHADTLTVLAELPSRWAHTCIALPPRGTSRERALAVLTQVHRVLREDGTLWLLHTNPELCDELRGAGWVEQPPPGWARPLAGLRSLTRLTKDTPLADPCSLVRRPQCASWRRPSWPTPRAADRAGVLGGLTGQCVLASTTRIACGSCGAPYHQGAAGKPLVSCAHHNPTGRCLVLDPFYHPANGTLDAARGHGRSFLGITDSQAGERE
jgi:hypothetical protein